MIDLTSFIDHPDAAMYPIKAANPLWWRHDLGYGFLRSNGYSYDSEYWHTYQSYRTEMGDKLTKARCDFIRTSYDKNFKTICDVGIGSGQFIEQLGCFGYDVNLIAINWLKERGAFIDPYVDEDKIDALTFWDVLEHIEDPSALLNKFSNIFLSMPIHESVEVCLRSKHLKPNEHIWHFTHVGIQNFMKRFGFQMAKFDDRETQLGRESINSYHFVRICDK